MFIKVKILTGFLEPLLYQVPDSWHNAPLPGMLVTVPMRSRTVAALILEVLETVPPVKFSIKEAGALQTFPTDPYYLPFINALGNYHQLDEVHFIKRMRGFLKNAPAEEILLQEATPEPHKKVVLTAEQQAVVDFLLPHIVHPTYTPTLLHGVTGSGKTEVYKKIIEYSFLQGKTTLLLLPEVTLAVQFEKLLHQQLTTNIPIVSFHSATSAKDKKMLWNNLLQQKAQLIIGVHLPILLPIGNLGAIIVDEEHEVGFQEKKHPKLNTKEAALLRAQTQGIPILLGSATPSISSLHTVKTRGWNFFQLKKRFAGAFPKVEFVHLLDKKQRANFWISNELVAALKKQFLKKEQTIIFLNRRGVSFFVQCKGCSFVFCCSSCSVSLTLHADNSLRCHYCQYQQQQPERCPQCKDTEFLKKGIGTQQVVTILQKMFPTARIGRADMDVTVNRKVWQKTMDAFEKQELDILVGTQTITKGYHFPNVTLVGILWGDINLNFPFYNAQETTLQQLIQVAGRAGRQRADSTVIVQAMGKHPLFNFVNEVDYPAFYETEIAQRAEVGYPPIRRFVEIELKHAKEEVVAREALQIAYALMEHKAITVLGPTLPPVARIKKISRRKIYLKADSFAAISSAYKTINHALYKSDIYFTPNPLS